MQPSKLLGEILRKARESRHWSQIDVAHRMGINPSTVSRWERDLIRPSFFHRQRLSYLFRAHPEVPPPAPEASVRKERGTLIVTIKPIIVSRCSASSSFAHHELKGEEALREKVL